MVLEDLFDVMRGFESDQDDKYSLTAYYLNRNHLGIPAHRECPTNLSLGLVYNQTGIALRHATLFN